MYIEKGRGLRERSNKRNPCVYYLGKREKNNNKNKKAYPEMHKQMNRSPQKPKARAV